MEIDKFPPDGIPPMLGEETTDQGHPGSEANRARVIGGRRQMFSRRAEDLDISIDISILHQIMRSRT
jgi:hypothetical protein